MVRAVPVHWKRVVPVAVVVPASIQVDLAVRPVPVEDRHVRPSLVAGNPKNMPFTF